MNRYEKALEPFTKGRGIDWEVQVQDVDVSPQFALFWSISTTHAHMQRVTWNENGINPPLPNTKAEDEWKSLNRPVPY